MLKKLAPSLRKISKKYLKKRYKPNWNKMFERIFLFLNKECKTKKKI
jgi:hypothetical protein